MGFVIKHELKQIWVRHDATMEILHNAAISAKNHGFELVIIY